MSQQLQRTTYRRPAVAAPSDQQLATAQRQFVLSLNRQAAREAEDRRLIALHKQRTAERAVKDARNKRIIIRVALVCAALALALAGVAIHSLMSLGLTFGHAILAALGLIVLLPTGGSCCTIIVIHQHG